MGDLAGDSYNDFNDGIPVVLHGYARPFPDSDIDDNVGNRFCKEGYDGHCGNQQDHGGALQAPVFAVGTGLWWTQSLDLYPKRIWHEIALHIESFPRLLIKATVEAGSPEAGERAGCLALSDMSCVFRCLPAFGELFRGIELQAGIPTRHLTGSNLVSTGSALRLAAISDKTDNFRGIAKVLRPRW